MLGLLFLLLLALPGPERQTLTMREACAILGISERTGYRLAAAGTFPVRVLQVGWSKKVSRRELESYLDGAVAS